ncbi:PhzF family phenazine biosynthesis protein [Deinococcus sp. YIM 77859]|uniref:PhzF family phenazine biosynthesis protein n=1 Tax=Deinococcus sp. YIM 77859 TaxID=1540221 RepID=UPI00054F8213|nr:PhzF family phenazine biosynthesis protein [Deinococcus sp. YIM 77859]
MDSLVVPTHYRVLSPPQAEGGKTVAVFPEAAGDLQARAAASGAPLSVFVEAVDAGSVTLRVFTPLKEKGSSDSGALAALAFLHGQGELLDVVDVRMGEEVLPAQLCGGEWLLRQGEVQVTQAPPVDLSPLGLEARSVQVASAGRPNLMVETSDTAALDALTPNAEAVAAVNRATGTTGLVLYAPGGPGRAEVSFRAFGPLRGFEEDAASSQMFACLVGALGAQGRLPEGTNLLRGAQRMPGTPARLTAQYAETGGGFEVWVGGSARRRDP